MSRIAALGLVLLMPILAHQSAAQVTAPREKVVHVASLPSKNLAEGVTNRAVAGALTMMMFNDLAAGSTVPEHNHLSEQITYVVSGRLRFVVEGREHILGPGDAIVVPAYVPHGAETLEAARTIESFGPPHALFLDIAG